MKRSYAERRVRGVCGRCGAPTGLNGRGTRLSLCPEHLKANRERVRRAKAAGGARTGRETKARLQREFSARQKKAGLCRQCLEPAARRPDGRIGTLCEKHRERRRARDRKAGAREDAEERKKTGGRRRKRIDGTGVRTARPGPNGPAGED